MVLFGLDLYRRRSGFIVLLVTVLAKSFCMFTMIHTMIHLLPSNSFRGGFFVRKLSGLGFLPGGAGELLRPIEEELLLRSGTTAPARNVGFLCVICEASTFFSPEVMPSPRCRSAKTAPMSAAGAFFAEVGGRPGGGGGGGGGGPPAAGAGSGGAGGTADFTPDSSAATWRNASAASTPWGFHWTPLGWCCLTYAIRERITL
jgi:hypothetical protein